MTEVYAPYNGMTGWSGTNTSRDRAVFNLSSGRELNNQDKALSILKEAGANGVTWRELSDKTGMHHGTSSGVLSLLHQSSAIVRAIRARNRSKIYVHADYKHLVAHEVYKKREKFCPHCGNDINT